MIDSEINELRNVAKERLVMLVQDVKKVRDDVNLKLEEMKKEVSQEISEVNPRYTSIQEKVDIIAGAVTNFIQTFQATVPTIEAKASDDKEQFAKLKELLGELKSIVSKPTPQSFLTSEFLTQKLNVLDQVIQKVVAPITKFAQMLPSNAPPAIIGVQGGEKKFNEGKSKVSNVTKAADKLKVITSGIPSKII